MLYISYTDIHIGMLASTSTLLSTTLSWPVAGSKSGTMSTAHFI